MTNPSLHELSPESHGEAERPTFRQLHLALPSEDQWRIDEDTRKIGLEGVRAAREALSDVRPEMRDPSYRRTVHPSEK